VEEVGGLQLHATREPTWREGGKSADDGCNHRLLWWNL
jgi:hypothetical protein